MEGRCNFCYFLPRWTMEDLVSVFPRYLHESTFPSESMCSPSIYSFHDFCDSNPLVTPLRSSFDREKRKKWSHIEWRCIGFPDLTLVKKVTWFGKSKDFKGKLRYNFYKNTIKIRKNSFLWKFTYRIPLIKINKILNSVMYMANDIHNISFPSRDVKDPTKHIDIYLCNYPLYWSKHRWTF